MRVALAFILVLLAASASGYRFLGGEVFLVRPQSPYIDHSYVPPEYLSVEDLVLYTCVQEKDAQVQSSVICLDDNSFRDIELVRWLDSENCYIGAYDLNLKDCSNLLIQSQYTKDGEVVTIEQKVKANRWSSILDHVLDSQYSDGGWRNAVESAGGIWVLSHYRRMFADEIEMGVDWLKLNRNNEEKCWPNKDCSVATTAKILAYLTLADVNISRRIMHDGVTFLENNQNFYYDDETWNITVSPFESGNTSCIISYENSILNNESFALQENSLVRYEIDPEPNAMLYVVCDQNIRANLTSADSEQVFVYEGDNMSYTMPDNCWSNDHKWGECSLSATLFAAMTNISEAHRELALGYLAGQLRRERSGQMYIGPEKNVTLAAVYAYITGNRNVTAWLRYRQNNDGSWGEGNASDLVEPTGFGILGLLESGFSRTDEPVEDAEEWINQQELRFSYNLTTDYVAWNDTEKNALAFIVLKNNARPAVKSNPMVVYVDQEKVEVEIYNPTTFELADVKLEFSDNLDDMLEIEQENRIGAYSYIRQSITKKKREQGNVYGYLYVRNNNEEIGKIPVMITNFPQIEISAAKDKLLVFGKSAKAAFSVQKTGHAFKCSLEWDDSGLTSRTDYEVTGDKLEIDLVFREAMREEKTYTGKFTCTSGGYTFINEAPIYISRYESFPFSVRPETLTINSSGRSGWFVVENNLDETLEVEAGFLKSEPHFELSRQELSLDPNAVANITIYNNVAPNKNLTGTNVIEVSALGQERQVSLRVFITALPEKRANPLVIWIVLGVLAMVLGVGGYYAYTYRSVIMNFFRKGSKVDQVRMRIKRLEQKEKETAIQNMVNILRILRKDDAQIRARLREEEFSDEEIDAALAGQEAGEEENTDVFAQ